MTTEYEHLNLDDLLDISRTDAEYAGDMAEQARVLREMSQSLRDKVDLMRSAMRTLFGDESEGGPESAVWKGTSSGMMRVELDRLYQAAQDAPDILDNNASSMDDFATRTQDTLAQIDQLHVSSKGHGEDVAGEGSDTAKARRIMQSASKGYLTSAESMEEPKFYNGLRKNPPEGSQEEWPQQYGTAGTASQPGAPAGTEPANSTDVSLQSTHGGVGQLAAGAPTGPASPVGAPAASPSGYTPLPPPAWTPQQPTVRPVIGGRPGGTGVRPTARPTPNPGGVVRPVIGGRPAVAGVPPASRPVPSPDGTVRPVIGGRPGVAGIPVAPRPAPSPDGTVRPVIGGRPGVAGVVPAPRPAPSPGGVVRPVIGGAGFSSSQPPQTEGTARAGMGPRPMVPYGVAGRAAPAANPAPRPGAVPTNGPREPFPTSPRATNGALAVDPRSISPTGQRLASPNNEEPTTAKRTAPARPAYEAKPPRKKPAGQRAKKMVKQNGPALERAVKRGARRRKEAPGQEVFAKFAQQRARANPQAGAESDSDSPWYIEKPTLRSVMGGRRSPDSGTARS